MREIRTLRCDVEGTGNVAWSRYCDTRRRKSELTVNTNFDLNRRASPRPYLREAGGAIPSAYSPNLRKTAPQRRFMPKLPIRHPHGQDREGSEGSERSCGPLKFRGGTRMLCRCLALTRKECALESKMRI